MTWILLALGSAFFAALVAILGKMGLKGVDSTVATTVRAIVMALFLFIIALTLGKMKLATGLGGRALTYIVLSGIAGALSWLCYFGALRLGNAAGVAALDRLSVVMVLLLAFIFLGEAMTAKTVIGAVLITVGALLFVF